MSNWHVGQKVVCVDPAYELVKDRTYSVLGVAGCPCYVWLDVGVWAGGGTGYSKCFNCGTRRRGNYFRSERFRPFDELDAVIEEIEAMEAPVEPETVEA